MPDLRVLRGERGRRSGKGATPPAGRPEKPPYLDGAAAAEWDRIIPVLEAFGVLAAVDGFILAIYCTVHARMVAAEAKIRELGLTTKTARGGITTSPYVRIAQNCADTCLRILIEFGATPASRARVSVAAPVVDELAVFLGKRTES